MVILIRSGCVTLLEEVNLIKIILKIKSKVFA